MDTASSTFSAWDSSRSQMLSNMSSSVTENQSSLFPSSSSSSEGSADNRPGTDLLLLKSSRTLKMPSSESLSASAALAVFVLVCFFLLPVFLWKAAKWSVDPHSQHLGGFHLLFPWCPWPPLPCPHDGPPCTTAIASSWSQSFTSLHVGYFAFWWLASSAMTEIKMSGSNVLAVVNNQAAVSWLDVKLASGFGRDLMIVDQKSMSSMLTPTAANSSFFVHSPLRNWWMSAPFASFNSRNCMHRSVCAYAPFSVYSLLISFHMSATVTFFWTHKVVKLGICWASKYLAICSSFTHLLTSVFWSALIGSGYFGQVVEPSRSPHRSFTLTATWKRKAKITQLVPFTSSFGTLLGRMLVVTGVTDMAVWLGWWVWFGLEHRECGAHNLWEFEQE